MSQAFEDLGGLEGGDDAGAVPVDGVRAPHGTGDLGGGELREVGDGQHRAGAQRVVAGRGDGQQLDVPVSYTHL
ncbi:hypothetical protein EF908_19240, partial [Streptomyces sp. WAC04770]